MKKVSNIIFSDFIGTLASGDDELTMEESCYIIQEFLLNYLVENNYFVIISSTNHFWPQLFTECLKYSTSNLSDEQKSKLFYYMVDAGSNNSIDLNGFHLNLLDCDKSSAVELALNNHFNGHELGKILSAGDTDNDIGMLLKISDLGGESFLVKDHRYYDTLLKEDITKLINGIPPTDRRYYNEHPIELIQFKQQLSSELNSLYKNGKITSEQLAELVMFYTEINQYMIKKWYKNHNSTTLSMNEVTEISKKMTLVKDRREIFNIFNSKMKDF